MQPGGLRSEGPITSRERKMPCVCIISLTFNALFIRMVSFQPARILALAGEKPVPPGMVRNTLFSSATRSQPHQEQKSGAEGQRDKVTAASAVCERSARVREELQSKRRAGRNIRGDR